MCQRLITRNKYHLHFGYLNKKGQLFYLKVSHHLANAWHKFFVHCYVNSHYNGVGLLIVFFSLTSFIVPSDTMRGSPPRGSFQIISSSIPPRPVSEVCNIFSNRVFSFKSRKLPMAMVKSYVSFLFYDYNCSLFLSVIYSYWKYTNIYPHVKLPIDSLSTHPVLNTSFLLLIFHFWWQRIVQLVLE